jgi:gliding motility-associated-like protein
MLSFTAEGFTGNSNHINPKRKFYKKYKNAAIIPPTIAATGNQIYCPGTQQRIVQSVTITNDPLEPTTKSVTIQIATGYIISQDLLTLIGLHPTITSSWSSLEGSLTLSNPTGAPYADFEAAIRDVVYSSTSLSPASFRDFSINLGFGNVSYLPSNGHFYEYVPALGISWIDARNAANTKNYYDLQGYLATLTTADESQLAGIQAPGAGWIGGSDSQIEGTWKWVTGPEGLANGGTGTTFWIGVANGTATPPFNFAFWNNGEPNQFGGANEDYAHITAPGVGILGSWNDLTVSGDPTGNYQPKGYVVEYGGLPGEIPLQTSTSTRISMVNITSSTGNSICGSGSTTLQATANGGTINWYSSPTGGTLLGTGSSFVTPFINSTTTFYAVANAAGCISGTRTAVVATVLTIPIITNTVPAQRCDPGTVLLAATASAGTINWYSSTTGGTAITSGNTFNTPILDTTTTYYVDATANGCTTPNRTAIIATVNNTPTIIGASSAARCDSGTVTINAIPSEGTVNWYDMNTGGTIIFTGNSFTTPNINSTTTYYAEAVLNNCSSARVSVTATIYPVSKETEEVILCQGKSIILDAAIPNRTYLWSPGGETTQTITVAAIGDYSVTISAPAVASCDSKKDISVIEHAKPVINAILVNGNSISIELDKSESYFEYSIDGIFFQSLNEFSFLPSGQYIAYVRENNGCNIVMQNFTIFSIPKFFTPNNDGYNDLYQIQEMKDYPNSKAQIFDRYGKLLKELTSSNYGWDGTFNTINLPSDDYWYRLQLDDLTPILKGHFSLKR